MKLNRANFICTCTCISISEKLGWDFCTPVNKIIWIFLISAVKIDVLKNISTEKANQANKMSKSFCLQD